MTNCEKIGLTFPNMEWTFDWDNDVVIARIDGINNSCFDVNWWNAEYIESVDDYARTAEMLEHAERALENRSPVDKEKADRIFKSMAH